MRDFIGHYSTYYGDAQLAQWRELGARGKAANIVALWGSMKHSSAPFVVDIGCGDGAVIRELDRLGFAQSYLGLEISESGVQAAQYNRYSSPTTFTLFDGHHIHADDASFDLVILSHVLEHVEEPRRLLCEAARVGKNVFVEVPLELNARTPRNFHWTDVGHINLYNPVVIRHLLQSVGLRIITEKTVCPSRDIFQMQRPGMRGALHWAVKASLLKAAPLAAWRLLTYHEALLASTEPTPTTTQAI